MHLLVIVSPPVIIAGTLPAYTQQFLCSLSPAQICNFPVSYYWHLYIYMFIHNCKSLVYCIFLQLFLGIHVQADHLKFMSPSLKETFSFSQQPQTAYSSFIQGRIILLRFHACNCHATSKGHDLLAGSTTPLTLFCDFPGYRGCTDYF